MEAETIEPCVVDLHGSRSSWVELWENQRYKPMNRGWGKPFGDNAAYTDIDGVNINVLELKDVILKDGWMWNSNWMWDNSGEYGQTDENGWSYATTFDDLFATSKARGLSGEKKPMTSLVRRRRLLRQRQCIPESPASSLFANRLKWNDMQTDQLNALLSIYTKDVQSLQIYEGKRNKSYIYVIEKILDRRHEGAVRYCSEYVLKIRKLKAFLKEKGTIENNYAKSLGDLSRRWLNGGKADSYSSPVKSSQRRGSASAASTTVPPNASDGSVGMSAGDDKMPSGAKANTGEPKPNSTAPVNETGVGFFMSMSLAHFEVSDRLEAYANRILTNLISETEDMESLLTDLRSDCISTGKKLKMDVINSEISIAAVVKAIVSGLAIRKRITAAECDHLYLSLRMEYGRGPADSDKIGTGNTDQDSEEHLGERTYLDATTHDIWYLMQCYRAAVLSADAKLLCYKAFLNSQLKEIQDMVTKIGNFLQLVLKMMVNEQVQSWVDFNDIITHMDIYDQSGSKCRTISSDSSNSKTMNISQNPTATATATATATVGSNAKNKLRPSSNQMVSNLNRNVMSNISLQFGIRESIAYSKLPQASLSSIAMHGFMYYQPTKIVKGAASKRRSLVGAGPTGGAASGASSAAASGFDENTSLDRASVVGFSVEGNHKVSGVNEKAVHVPVEDGPKELPWTLCRVVLTYEGTLYLYKLTDKQIDRLSKCSAATVYSCSNVAPGPTDGHNTDTEFKSQRVIAPLQFSEMEKIPVTEGGSSASGVASAAAGTSMTTGSTADMRGRSIPVSNQAGDQLGSMSRWCGDSPDITVFTEMFSVDVPVANPIDYCLELRRKKARRRQSAGNMVEFHELPQSPIGAGRAKVTKRGVNADFDGCLLKLWYPTHSTTVKETPDHLISNNELLTTTRSWIRSLSNPLVDPFYEPPVAYPYI